MVEREQDGAQGADEASVREEAEKRVERKTELLRHIGSYVFVNILIFVIWLLTTGTGGYPWFLWVLGPWGVGLALHIIRYFIYRRGEVWRKQMLEKEMKKIERSE